MSDAEYLKAIGKNIKKIREKRNLKQMELADLCNFEKSNMNRIEAGRANLTITTLRKICKQLDVDIIELLSVK